MTKAYRTILNNAFEAGSKKAIGAKLIENVLHIAYETYCQEMLALQECLHLYIMTQAMDDNDSEKAVKLEERKTAVYDRLKILVERIPGILCEAGDILYLSLSAYKLAKSKDIEKSDGSFTIGTKRLVSVSPSAFRVIVESLLGNKIAGNTWDCGLCDFRKMTDSERSKLDKKLEKKRAREAKAQEKMQEAAKAKASPKAKEAKPSKAQEQNTTAPEKKAKKARKTTKAPAKAMETADTLPNLTDMLLPSTTKDKIEKAALVEEGRRLDGTAMQKSA